MSASHIHFASSENIIKKFLGFRTPSQRASYRGENVSTAGNATLEKLFSSKSVAEKPRNQLGPHGTASGTVCMHLTVSLERFGCASKEIRKRTTTFFPKNVRATETFAVGPNGPPKHSSLSFLKQSKLHLPLQSAPGQGGRNACSA